MGFIPGQDIGSLDEIAAASRDAPAGCVVFLGTAPAC